MEFLFSLIFMILIGDLTALQCIKSLKEIPSLSLHRLSNLAIFRGVSEANQIPAYLTKFLLIDALGYPRVAFFNGSSTDLFKVDEVKSFIEKACSDKRLECSSSALIFPAVWVPVDYHQKETVKADLIDLGPLGITGSFGWYVSSKFVQKVWKEKSIPVDHWRSLQTSAVTQNLMNADELDLIHVACGGCVVDVFYPRVCDPSLGGESGLCTLLISHETGICGRELQQQITYLNLRVAIAWLNTKPDSLVYKFKVHEKYLLFFAFKPSRLLSSENFTRIQFPPCRKQVRSYEELPPRNCSCQSSFELKKFVYSKKVIHEDVVDLIAAIYLPPKQHTNLIQRTTNSSPNNAACDWLLKNKDQWSPWIPNRKTAKKKIYLGGMFPSSSGPEAVWSSPGDEIGAIMAIERINKLQYVLRDYQLEMPIASTQCRRDLVLNAYIKFLNRDPSRKVVGILGPACSKPTMPIASVSRYHNMVVMGYGADDVSLSDRKRYPFFFRTAPSVDEFKFVYLALFDKFKWKSCFTLRDSRYPAGTVLSRTQYLTKHGIDVISRKIPTEEGLDVKAYVTDIRQSGNTIVILNAYPSATRAIVCEAFKQKLYPSRGYVWFLLDWLDNDWWDIDQHNVRDPSKKVPCTSAEVKSFVNQGYFSLSSLFYGDGDMVIVGGGTVREWKREYVKRTSKMGLSPSDYASLAHDAVWTYALALDALVKEKPGSLDKIFENTTSRLFRDYIEKTYFFGVSDLVHFRNGDRLSVINIKQKFATTSERIGQFVPDLPEDSTIYNGLLLLDEPFIKWPNGGIPMDHLPVNVVSSCAVESLRIALGISCTSAGILAAAIAIVLISLVLILVYWILKGRYSSKYRIIKRRLNQLGLLDSQTASTLFALDSWELSRDKIIMNRKLGEGAFGAVFGGEGLGLGKDGMSVSVAIKTLKTDASVEEKFEFLGEADTMKHFNHDNIVQLIGVCTTSEPVYLVMELMIHGDLKSFLLARRRLIDQHGTPEAEEVTSSNLTRMALDIARGLQYLSQKKYVHRDLALRNCMVGVGNVIKIGDFGLARQLNIKDYYRFERKGALPIRWMAPEAITEGLFTTQSDVWSFGVTLWELATLGGFPYQGASNHVVLEYVKDGNVLEIPQGCCDQMASLLRMCWRFDYLDRPTPYTLVRILTENQEIVSASIEVPPTSVTDDCIGRFYAPSVHGHGKIGRSSRTSSVSSQLSERLRVSGVVKESSHSSRKFTNSSSSGGHSPAGRKTSLFLRL